MKKLLIALTATSMLIATSTQAQFKILSVSKEKNMVSVDIGQDANVKPGNDLNVEWRDQECTLKVTKIDGNKATADGRECEFLDKLKKGDNVTLSDFQHTGKYMETAPVSEPEKDRKKMTWADEADVKGFGVTVGYNLATDIKMATGSSSSDLEGSGALSIGARYMQASEYGGGFMIGLGYEFARSFDALAGFTTGTSKAELGFLDLNINGLYRNDKLFGFGGINMPIITTAKNITTPSSALGLQVGAGFFAAPKLSVELYYRTVNFDWSGLDSARLWGFGLRGAYHF